MKNKMVGPLSVLAVGVAMLAIGIGAEHGWPRGLFAFGLETLMIGLGLVLIAYLDGVR